MKKHQTLLDALGGSEGCKQLSTDFYTRVGKDAVLRPLFPGKSQKCAIEEFSAFLIQFLEGDEAHTQRRWWLSLHESHARFQIGPKERAAWLKHMRATLEAFPTDNETRQALRQFFEQTSGYVVDERVVQPDHAELATHWHEQHHLEAAIAALVAERDSEAMALASHFAARPSVYIGLLARMIKANRAALIAFVVNAIQHNPTLITAHFAGKPLLHFAAGAGCLEVVTALLALGTDPNSLDEGGHTALYCVANECASDSGPRVVQALVHAGADVNAHGGVTAATPLHMAARRGFADIAQALLNLGANVNARDRKNETPLQRAINCRRPTVVQLLTQHVADNRQ